MRRYVLAAARVGLLVAVLASGVFFWIQRHYSRYMLADVTQVPELQVAIVFGAGIRPDGQLSPMLRDRVDTAISLYRAGKVRKLLMSGDNRFEWYDEPTRMYEYAVSQGVPAKDVVRDFAGRRTYDTCYRAAAIFGVSEAVLVTQQYHLPRALFTCRNLGVDAIGLVADRGTYGGTPYYALRDAAATVQAWLDVRILHPLPVLGEKVDLEI